MTEPLIRVFADETALVEAVASAFSESANEAAARRGLFSVALSGGTTPRAVFDRLVRPPYDAAIPWERVCFFWADERLVPPTDPESNFGRAWELLLSRVPVSPDNVFRVRGELPPGEAAADYGEQLARFATRRDPMAIHPWPRFDLVWLGLGNDGHTASLFPGSPLTTEPVIAVVADYDGRPAQRVTLAPPVFNDSRQLFFVVAGASKAEAVAAALQGPIDPIARPAQRVRLHDGQIAWFLDAAAAGRLV